MAVRDGTKDGQHDLPELYRSSVTQSHRRIKQVRAKAFYSCLLHLRRTVEVSWHLGNILARRVINNGLGVAMGCGIPETSCRQSLGVLSLRLKEISVTHNFHFHSHSLWPSIKKISIPFTTLDCSFAKLSCVRVGCLRQLFSHTVLSFPSILPCCKLLFNWLDFTFKNQEILIRKN